jgi:hypothetical protein
MVLCVPRDNLTKIADDAYGEQFNHQALFVDYLGEPVLYLLSLRIVPGIYLKGEGDGPAIYPIYDHILDHVKKVLIILHVTIYGLHSIEVSSVFAITRDVGPTMCIEEEPLVVPVEIGEIAGLFFKLCNKPRGGNLGLMGAYRVFHGACGGKKAH